MRAKMVTLCKMTLAIALAVGMFLGDYQMVNAAEKTDEIAETKERIEFVDENGEVMAVFTPYSESNPAPSKLGRDTKVNVNCSVPGRQQGYLSNIYNFSGGQKLQLNITINPQVSSNVGLYNRNTNSFGFPEGGLSSSGWYGTLEVSNSGRYSLAFQNNSGTTASYTGSYTF